MEELGKSRWEGNEHWFKFGHQAGLKRFDEISTLGSTATAIALRSVKYQLENEGQSENSVASNKPMHTLLLI